MLLREGGADGTHRDTQHTSRLAGPSVLAIGPRGMINRILEDARNRSIVFRRDEQQALGSGDIGL